MARALLRSKFTTSTDPEQEISPPTLISTNAQSRSDLKEVHRAPSLMKRSLSARKKKPKKDEINDRPKTSNGPTSHSRTRPDQPVPVQHEFNFTTTSPPLSTPASASQDFGAIGMALGSPRQNQPWSSPQLRQQEKSNLGSAQVAASSLESEWPNGNEGAAKAKSSKWKTFGNFFGAKRQLESQSQASSPFYQLETQRTSPVEATEKPHWNSTSPKNEPPRPNSSPKKESQGRGRGYSRSERLVDTNPPKPIEANPPKPAVKPAHMDIMAASRLRTVPPAMGGVSPKVPPKDYVTNPVLKPKPVDKGPLMLNVDIPSVQLDRYSVMFGSLLGSAPKSLNVNTALDPVPDITTSPVDIPSVTRTSPGQSPRTSPKISPRTSPTSCSQPASSLLARRQQGQLEPIKTVTTSNVSGLNVPIRRATSPAPSSGSSFSLFPATAENKRATNTKAKEEDWSKLLKRSHTAPSGTSPLRGTFEISRSNTTPSPNRLVFNPNKAAFDSPSSRHTAESHVIVMVHSPAPSPNPLARQITPDTSFLTSDESDDEAEVVHDARPLKPQPLAISKPQKLENMHAPSKPVKVSTSSIPISKASGLSPNARSSPNLPFESEVKSPASPDNSETFLTSKAYVPPSATLTLKVPELSRPSPKPSPTFQSSPSGPAPSFEPPRPDLYRSRTQPTPTASSLQPPPLKKSDSSTALNAVKEEEEPAEVILKNHFTAGKPTKSSPRTAGDAMFEGTCNFPTFIFSPHNASILTAITADTLIRSASTASTHRANKIPITASSQKAALRTRQRQVPVRIIEPQTERVVRRSPITVVNVENSAEDRKSHLGLIESA